MRVRSFLPLCGSWNRKQVNRLGNKCPYPLSHLIGPCVSGSFVWPCLFVFCFQIESRASQLGLELTVWRPLSSSAQDLPMIPYGLFDKAQSTEKS